MLLTFRYNSLIYPMDIDQVLKGFVTDGGRGGGYALMP
jgi:hypothetical protein